MVAVLFVGANGKSNGFLYIHNSNFSVKMPTNNEIRVKVNNSNHKSALVANVKATSVLLMLVLTFINPFLFVVPFIVCFLSAKKGGLL